MQRRFQAKHQELMTAAMNSAKPFMGLSRRDAANADAASDAAADGDDVVDADFEEVDDENRQSA